MTSPLALVLGVLVASPALWGAVVTGEVSVDAALQRLLLSLLAAGLATMVLQRLWNGYVDSVQRARVEEIDQGSPARRRSDVR